MQQTTQIDSTNAYSKVRYAIQGLIEFHSDDDRDDVLYAAYKLNSVLRTVHDNYLFWNKETIKEFVFSQNDPLRYIKVKSDKLDQMVRSIQENMIVQFS